MKINKLCISCSNSGCLIKKHCSTDLLEDVEQHKIISTYRSRQFIIYEGEHVNSIFFLLSGKVKVYKKGAFKKDQIVRFSIDGDILGHRGLISSGIYPVSIQTITDSEICHFSKEYFLNLIERVPKLGISLMLLYANELNKEETKLRNMSVFTVREKVAVAILSIVGSFGTDENLNINNIDLLSRQDIGELVGLKANQVTKIIAEFKLDGIIEIIDNRIKVSSLQSLEKIVAY